jgi:hypothetical protein
VCILLFFWKFSSLWCQSLLSFCLRVHIKGCGRFLDKS